MEDLKNRIILSFEKLKSIATNDNLFARLRNNFNKRYDLCIKMHRGHTEN